MHAAFPHFSCDTAITNDRFEHRWMSIKRSFDFNRGNVFFSTNNILFSADDIIMSCRHISCMQPTVASSFFQSPLAAGNHLTDYPSTLQHFLSMIVDDFHFASDHRIAGFCFLPLLLFSRHSDGYAQSGTFISPTIYFRKFPITLYSEDRKKEKDGLFHCRPSSCFLLHQNQTHLNQSYS